MKNLKLLQLILFISFCSTMHSQTAQLGTPNLAFDGSKLTISYDMINENQSDQFYVWIVIQKKDGQILKMNSLSGDVGDIKAGKNKVIAWEPAKDSVYLNEEVSVEVKAEKYVKEFNKGSMMLLSIAVPGLGQTKMNKGKPYWLMGIASYGALAGGLISYSGYKKSYDSYLLEENDAQKRADYLSKAEKQASMAGALFVTAAAIWTANLIWVAASPNRYKPLKYRPITFAPSADPLNRAALLTFQYKF